MTNIAPMNIISSITGNLSEEDVKNFQFCDREFMAYRRQAANALTMMVYYFGKIQEILSDDDFEIYWSKYLGISKRTKYKWLAAYLRAKQKLSDGEGNIDLQFFSRFSLTGIAMLEDANDEVIEEIKARNPGKEAITQKEIETVIKKFQDQLSESKAIAEKPSLKKKMHSALQNASVRIPTNYRKNLPMSVMPIRSKSLNSSKNSPWHKNNARLPPFPVTD